MTNEFSATLLVQTAKGRRELCRLWTMAWYNDVQFAFPSFDQVLAEKSVYFYYSQDLAVINNTQYLMQCNPELTDIQLISLHATIFFFI